eukprot:5546728-Karenia_brevis.AAC.1
MDHFNSLQQQLEIRASDVWVLGGDFNSHTNCAQPSFGTSDPLDFLADGQILPERTSSDKRPINNHGRRLLNALCDKG